MPATRNSRGFPPDGSVEKRTMAPVAMLNASASCREMSTSGGAWPAAVLAWPGVAAAASVIAQQTIDTTAVRTIARIIVTPHVFRLRRLVQRLRRFVQSPGHLRHLAVSWNDGL